jgi:hypothetical protein
MSSIINADTSNGLKLTSDTSGEVKIQSAGADIVTVDSTGITMAAGKTIPASALTGTLPAIDGSSLTNLPQPAALTTASGSAPSYSARAWVNFNGQGTVAIRASDNVSSITDNGVGLFRVNFTTAMPDANFAVSGAGQFDTSGPVNAPIIGLPRSSTTQGTGYVDISSLASTTGYDCLKVLVIIHR